MKRFSVIFVILLVGIGVMLNSCVEREEFNLSEDNPILRFSISSEEVKTRAAVAAEEESLEEVDTVEEDDTVEEADIVEEADTVCWSVMEVEGDEDFSEPLYLTMVTEDREAVAADEYVSEDAQTRGAPVSTNTFVSMYGGRGFGLFAYVYEPNTWNANTTTSEYIHNRPVQYYNNSYWGLADASSTKQYYWPGANYKVRFYAYAPISGGYDKDNNFVPGYYGDIIKVQSGAYKGVPKIPISVSTKNIAASDDKMTTHPDLVIAKTAELPGNHNQEQPLEFKHAMAAISFKVGAMFADDAVKITKIEFKNVLRSGTINLETQQWENIGTDKATITLTKDIAISGDNGQQGGLTAEDYFMMLPQTLPSDAKVAVTFVLSSDGTEHTVETSMGGIKWEMGHLHIYTLTAKLTPTDEYTFTVNTAPSKTSTSYTSPSATYLGGVGTTGNITSYLTHTNVFGIKTKKAVKWTTEYSTYNGSTWSTWTTTRPEFFSSFTAGANGKADGTTDTFNGTIAPITPSDPKNPFGANVANRPVNSGTTNLYTSNGNTTANCYVINKAGTYTFPLVYGNSIKNGAINTKAFNPGGDATNEHYTAFVDHLNAAITAPWIYPNKLNKAKLMWTDAPNLIKDVKLSTASQTMTIAGTAVRYITFTVPKEHLAPGNAVIAILDGNDTVMWSWHIWVTPWTGTSVAVDYKFTTSGDVTHTATFDFSNTILGYCPARDATWVKRAVKVRFKQDGSNKVSSAYSFYQSGYDLEYGEGNMPYYQWGRKDPLLMFNYVTKNGVSTAGSEKICYGISKKNIDLKVYSSGATYTTYKYSGYFDISGMNGSGRGNGVYMYTSIKNPCTFYPRRTNDTMSDSADDPEYDWCDQMGYNRWDGATKNNVSSASAPNDKASTKTIYDPCPPGWCVPTTGAFYGLTAAGGATTYSTPQTQMSTATNGDNTIAYRVKGRGGNGIKLPITGDRNRYYGSPWHTSLASRNVQVWTATPATFKATDANPSRAAYFMSLGGATFVCTPLAKSSGFAVLPVKETIRNYSW